MKLTAEQVSNLTLLANFMEGLHDPDFTMRWYLQECGSPACALGHATTIPELQAKGVTQKYLGLSNGYIATIERAEKFFGEGTYLSLFSEKLMHSIKTPQQWAAHCRAFLKENGYEITKPDAFKTFMDRALAPVDTEIMETS